VPAIVAGDVDTLAGAGLRFSRPGAAEHGDCKQEGECSGDVHALPPSMRPDQTSRRSRAFPVHREGGSDTFGVGNALEITNIIQ
jgi:hypothetical protein